MTFAIVFPGQGSQSVGMMAALAEEWPVVKQTFAEASDALGYDVWKLCQEGPESELNQTDKTQPAMLAAGFATWRVWQAAVGVPPRFLAGHSLGEYTALVAAGALSFSDAVKLVEYRGQVMQEAVPSGVGAMAAILGMADEDVVALCNDVAEAEVVQAVNFNSPGQVVIAGNAAAVARAVELSGERGAKKAVMLPVSVPSHCSLMLPAAEKLTDYLSSVEISAPSIDVIHNADVCAHRDAASIRDVLAKQLFTPVRWVETIQHFSGAGVNGIIECGPGKVLAGLNKRIDRSLSAVPIQDVAGLQRALDTVQGE